MKNFIQDDDCITVAAPSGGVTSGGGVIVGSLFGVAATTATEGEPLTIAMEGVYELPKLSTTVIVAGGPVSWDAAAHRCDAPGAGRYPIGAAIEASGNGAGTVKVRLDGVSTAAA
jgi:predicted RecA/RadA family phage recombinase